MKSILLTLGIVLSISTLSAQQTLLVNVVNAKGKSLAHKATVSLKSQPTGQSPDQDAPLKLQPAPNDTLRIVVGNTIGTIPTRNLSELTIVVHKNTMTNQETGEKYPVSKLPRFDPHNIAGSSASAMFIDLESLVTSKFPSVRIQQGNAFLIGNTTGSQQTPMLILVDGNQVINFAQANETISVQQVKSIDIKRSDPIYGIRGLGGIMEITLIKGRDL